MGRGQFHAIPLILAAMLAWPWNVALAAAEGSQALSTPSRQALAERGGRAKEVGRSMRWGSAACPALSPDFDEEEEGDEAATWDPVAVLPRPVLLVTRAASDPRQDARITTTWTLPFERLRQLRC